MKTYLISYADSNFRLSQILLGLTAKLCGCDVIISKNQKDLHNSTFFQQNKAILSQKRGAGFWLWKYYFINELMLQVKTDDVIIYCDAGIIFRKTIKPLIDILKNKTQGVLLFYNDYKNKQWTKRDCFVKLDCDTDNYYNSPLIFGGFQLFQKNSFSEKFVKEVLNYSCSDNIITDSENILGKPNLEGFIENRHDQSVTSLIAHKNRVKLYPDASQFRTKNIIYEFPVETTLKTPLYKNIIYVHRLSGLKIFTLPFKILGELKHKTKPDEK